MTTNENNIIRTFTRDDTTVTYTGVQLATVRSIIVARGEFTIVITDVDAASVMSFRISGGTTYTGLNSQYHVIPNTLVNCAIVAGVWGPNVINIADSTTTTQYELIYNGWMNFIPTARIYGGAVPAGNVTIQTISYSTNFQ